MTAGCHHHRADRSPPMTMTCPPVSCIFSQTSKCHAVDMHAPVLCGILEVLGCREHRGCITVKGAWHSLMRFHKNFDGVRSVLYCVWRRVDSALGHVHCLQRHMENPDAWKVIPSAIGFKSSIYDRRAGLKMVHSATHKYAQPVVRSMVHTKCEYLPVKI